MAIIGIVGRKENFNNEILDGNIVPYDYINMVLKYSNTPISLVTNENYENISEEALLLCDGIIIPGGTEIKEYHFVIIDYCLKNNIPLLGICLGMQAIALYSNRNNELYKVLGHMPSSSDAQDVKNFKHNIEIEDKSFFYELYGKELEVNSRHNYAIKKVDKPFVVAAKCKECIEVIEYIDEKNFIIGVQFHPEVMENMDLLLNEFFQRCKKTSII